MKIGRKACALAAGTLLFGCASRGAEALRRGATSDASAGTTPTGAGPPPPPLPALVSTAPSPTLLITEPDVLAALERQGLSLAALLGGAESDNRALSQLPRFAPVVTELTREIARAAAGDKGAGVEVARFAHRLFDARFLRLPQARFTLAGVVNRPDRAPFAPASCGEVRLIYRLGYVLDEQRASKLPMTLGVELTVPRGEGGCRAAAARWLEPGDAAPEARAQWLRSPAGPLAPDLIRLGHDRAQVVVNLQLVRWPSTVRPDLGGHAEYLLRAFRPDGGGVLRPEPLENTIEPSDFRDANERGKLAVWLGENSARVDAGTAVLPAVFLTSRALSVTPRGLARLANRPFSQVLTASQLTGAANGKVVKSGAGFVRRLDELSCPGCHQARSVAGFHLLGEDRGEVAPENALALPVSPQVTADLPRRLRIARQLLAGEEPDFSAPFAEHTASLGNYGDACGLGNDATFDGWSCAPDLVCSAIEANEGDALGRCLPKEPQVGDACERGGVSQTPDRLRDRVKAVATTPCPNMVCNRSGVGFPGGMCTATCQTPGADCGSIAILDPFNACLARGESFLACIRGNVRPAGLRACDEQRACRDDYVCARGASGGVCLPPYFVFQLRVDGHSNGLR